jgi:hypothetical protein
MRDLLIVMVVILGAEDGVEVGAPVEGTPVGALDGEYEGLWEDGTIVGKFVGCEDGAKLGSLDGFDDVEGT